MGCERAAGGAQAVAAASLHDIVLHGRNAAWVPRVNRNAGISSIFSRVIDRVVVEIDRLPELRRSAVWAEYFNPRVAAEAIVYIHNNAVLNGEARPPYRVVPPYLWCDGDGSRGFDVIAVVKPARLKIDSRSNGIGRESRFRCPDRIAAHRHVAVAVLDVDTDVFHPAGISARLHCVVLNQVIRSRWTSRSAGELFALVLRTRITWRIRRGSAIVKAVFVGIVKVIVLDGHVVGSAAAIARPAVRRADVNPRAVASALDCRSFDILHRQVVHIGKIGDLAFAPH